MTMSGKADTMSGKTATMSGMADALSREEREKRRTREIKRIMFFSYSCFLFFTFLRLHLGSLGGEAEAALAEGSKKRKMSYVQKKILNAVDKGLY